MPAATGTFRWTEAYRVNIAVLDQQHQELFEIINELDHALQKSKGADALDSVLQQLADYASVHCAAEEALMMKHDFPGLGTHRIQHEMFRERLAAFLKDHKVGKPGVAVELLLFLQSWLKQHVLKTDKLYSAYLNARGER